MRSAHLITLLLVLLPLLVAEGEGRGGRTLLASGWEPIDVRSAHIQDLASFAVGEHNREAKSRLVYKGVISAESYVPDPSRYRFVVEAYSDNHIVGKYGAEVVEGSPRRLVYFVVRFSS